MAYIGRDISNLSDRVVLDNITASATATYNLLLNSVAFVPSSAESLTVSLNGVIQKPQGSYTVSGSTIVFDSALTSSDVIDFILAERAITLTTIGSGTVNTSNLVDDAVTTAKINDGAITSAKLDSGLGLGKIGQVVQGTTTTEVSNTTTSYVDTSLTASITPTSTSSKILVTVHQNGARSQSDQNNNAIYLKLLRGSTDISQIFVYALYTGSGIDLYGTTISTSFLDTPSTTSATTYKTQFKNFVSSGHVRLQDTSAMSTITLMEVLA